MTRVLVSGNASERSHGHGSTPSGKLAVHLPQTDAGRALLVFFPLLVTYGYFFPRLNNWESNSRMGPDRRARRRGDGAHRRFPLEHW